MYTVLHGNRFAGRKFNVNVRRIREWRKKKEKISEQSKKSCGKERNLPMNLSRAKSLNGFMITVKKT